MSHGVSAHRIRLCPSSGRKSGSRRVEDRPGGPDFRQDDGYGRLVAMNIPPAHPLLLLSIVAGLAYPLLWDTGLSDAILLAAKGSGVALLALYAATQARCRDGWLLTAVMAFGALGDVLLNIRFEAGVLAFATGHMIAIRLYVRNRPDALQISQKWLLALLPLAAFAMPWIILGGHDGNIGFGVYALLLALMTVTAWISRFPTHFVGVGALLFLISDGLIVARMGPLAEVASVNLAVWLLYYLGQLLICVGVTRTLNRQ
jgi:uncharacterized membrane protein YhhN